MRAVSLNTCRRPSAAVLLLALLAACDNPNPPGPAPAPDVPPPTAAPAAETQPGSSLATVAIPALETALADAGPPATVVVEPELSAMSVARPANSKLGVPVDLRYRFDTEALTNQPVILHLAAVPRVSGGNLHVSIKSEPGVKMSSGSIAAQKATASTPYRQQVSVTRMAGGPQEVRVLVTMDLPEGSAFGYYSVPFGANPAAARKLDPAKLQ